MEYIQDSLFGKMFPELSAQTTEKTSDASLRHSAASKNPRFLYLNLKEGTGLLPDSLWVTDIQSHGEFMMLVNGAYRNAEKESTLSQILEANVQEKYYLSKRAALGIKNRAEKRGKTLPSMLLDALNEVIVSDG